MTTTPPDPNQPPYPAQPPGYPAQPGYPQQPPAQQPFGVAAPGPYQQAYPGAPMAPAAMPVGNRRPGMVTGAAVIAFIIGGISILFDLLAFGVLSTIGAAGIYTVILILSIVVGAVLIWGGVQALSGKDGRILVIAAGIAIVLNLISMIIYFSASSLLSMILPILIVVFMINPQSKAWITARGGKTF